MTSINRIIKFLTTLALCCACCVSTACSKKPAKTAPNGDTAVPKSTQKKSAQLMSDQQLMMDGLNQTPGERAAGQHQQTMDRRHDRQNDDDDQ